GIRRTFQQGRVIEDMSVGDYLTFAAGQPLDSAAVEEILDFFACPSPETVVASIDVATRRLVEVAGCFASKPSIVLLDEPGAGLAESESARLARSISEAPSRFGCGILLIEHDMEIVRGTCEVLTVLDFGSVISHGDTTEVLADPAVIAAYLGTSTESIAATS
ncbi:MAG: ABC transporter ATP-binding protein, partial [Actinobacteria bacterium]|nr:ABC transporter ATP-binding protein [Actinomycetota bacterium]